MRGALVLGAVVGALVGGALVRGVVGTAVVGRALLAGALGDELVTAGAGRVSGGGGNAATMVGVTPFASLMDTMVHGNVASGAPVAGALTVAWPIWPGAEVTCTDCSRLTGPDGPRWTMTV